MERGTIDQVDGPTTAYGTRYVECVRPRRPSSHHDPGHPTTAEFRNSDFRTFAHLQGHVNASAWLGHDVETVAKQEDSDNHDGQY